MNVELLDGREKVDIVSVNHCKWSKLTKILVFWLVMM